MQALIVKDFLTLRMEKGAKLLLALSGGPDSMALLHLLMEVKEDLDFSLHIAHVDHGWRMESQKEAKTLEKITKHLKLPFHLLCLKKMEGSDLENRAREKRLGFFSTLQREHHFQALLLAHHREDQAETVFKRIAEGSGIKGLGGLYPERMLGDLPLWRPLLPLSKEKLYSYLKRKRLHYFEDSTNKDLRFLRSRMRVELFPEVEKIFGKKIKGNFARIGMLFQELSLYFDEKGKEIKKSLTSGPFGSYLDLSLGLHPLDLKYFLKEMAPFTHDALEVLLKLIKERRSSRLIHASPYTFQLSRSHLFIYKEKFPDFFQNPQIWKKEEQGNWENFWQGGVKTPKGEYRIKKISELEPLIRKKVKKWYGSNQVPSFFYDKAPVFIKENGVISDCLTGRDLHKAT